MNDVQHDSSPQQQPEYGQFKQPEYGAVSSQYPGYDPYLYGKPEGEVTDATSVQQQPVWNAPNAQPAADGQSGFNGQAPNGQPFNGQPVFGQPVSGQPMNSQPLNSQSLNSQSLNGQSLNGQPNAPYPNGSWLQQGQLQPINLDDPNQNPLYGRWDPYAIVALICSVIYPLPVFPALIGGLSIRRTKIFRMKGRGLAIAAVVINILTTLLQLWMWIDGSFIFDLYSQLYNSLYGGSGGTSTDSEIVSV